MSAHYSLESAAGFVDLKNSLRESVAFLLCSKSAPPCRSVPRYGPVRHSLPAGRAIGFRRPGQIALFPRRRVSAASGSIPDTSVVKVPGRRLSPPPENPLPCIPGRDRASGDEREPGSECRCRCLPWSGVLVGRFDAPCGPRRGGQRTETRTARRAARVLSVHHPAARCKLPRLHAASDSTPRGAEACFVGSPLGSHPAVRCSPPVHGNTCGLGHDRATSALVAPAPRRSS